VYALYNFVNFLARSRSQQFAYEFRYVSPYLWNLTTVNLYFIEFDTGYFTNTSRHIPIFLNLKRIMDKLHKRYIRFFAYLERKSINI
jgi:hypothetical protein